MALQVLVAVMLLLCGTGVNVVLLKKTCHDFFLFRAERQIGSHLDTEVISDRSSAVDFLHLNGRKFAALVCEKP